MNNLDIDSSGYVLGRETMGSKDPTSYRAVRMDAYLSLQQGASAAEVTHPHNSVLALGI